MNKLKLDDISRQTLSKRSVTHRHNSEIQNALVSEKASYWAEKGGTWDINLAPLMPDEGKNFGGSLVLDFTKL